MYLLNKDNEIMTSIYFHIVTMRTAWWSWWLFLWLSFSNIRSLYLYRFYFFRYKRVCKWLVLTQLIVYNQMVYVNLKETTHTQIHACALGVWRSYLELRINPKIFTDFVTFFSSKNIKIYTFQSCGIKSLFVQLKSIHRWGKRKMTRLGNFIVISIMFVVLISVQTATTSAQGK